jgi:mercuric reductase
LTAPRRLARLEVTGMTCAGCEQHVGEALQAAGAEDVEASWRRSEVRFTWPAAVEETALREAVRGAGYEPGPLTVDAPAAPAVRTEAPEDYDLLVLGAGSAAFAAAIKGVEAGCRVGLVEAGTLGGTCVNVGCVPSKALLRAGELYWAAGNHPHNGITTAAAGVDLAALVRQKDELVAALRQHKYADLVEDYGFDVLRGRARFVDGETVEVDGRRVRAGAVLVATGASPAVPAVPGLEEAGYLTSTTALELKEVPRRLAVIGAGFIGLELGQFFLHLGAEVTWFSRPPRVAPGTEPEVSDAFAQVLREEGGTVLAPATVTAVERVGEVRRVTAVSEGREVVVEVDEILVAAGRQPNSTDLGLAAAGVSTDARGAIVVDAQLRTTNPGVWAAGDVTSGPQYVYVAAHAGALAAENALRETGRELDLTGLPAVIFTSPQIAAAGMTESEAVREGYDVKTSLLPLSAVPRAIVNRDTRGLIKLVADARTDRLLGAAVLAESAGEVIQSAVLAIKFRIPTGELASTFHPYLTMAEGLKLAAQAFTRDVGKLSCCAA